MRSTIQSIPVSSEQLPKQPNQALSHLPGPEGHWLLGNIKDLMPNPLPYLKTLQTRFGDCFTVGFFRNRRALIMVGVAANELLLLDREDNFSNRWGWEVVLPFFGRNILVRDFEDHRAHRKLMTHVFKAGALAKYLEQMQPILEHAVTTFQGTVDVYVETKQMALDIAIRTFTGIDEHKDIGAWNHDLNMVLSNVMAHRIRLPGSKYNQAIRARNRLRQRLALELAERRGQPADDLFSQLANLQDEQGRTLTDQDVIDHMFGLLFAAHDTTASSLAMLFWLLAEHPTWQDQAREECQALFRQTNSHDLMHKDLAKLPILEALFKETLRLYAPIQFLPRRCVSSFKFNGLTIPANSWILLAPQVTHFDPAYYPNPEAFEPERFLSTSANPPPFAFIPFGKGSHMCLGMHFAHMEIKAVLYRVLLSRQVRRAEQDRVDITYLPIVRPDGAMKLHFEPL